MVVWRVFTQFLLFGKRALKNTGKENLTMLCIQYKANAFGPDDSPMTDGNILKEPLKW